MSEVLGISLGAKTTLDNKLFVASTSRPFGTLSMFTSEGDSTVSPVVVGRGQKLMLNHHIGDETSQSIYIDFNSVENRTYLHEGYIMWQDASFDEVTMEAVPKVTPFTDSTNTFFDLYGGYLIVPAPGTGSIQILNDQQLVESPVSLDFGARDPSLWSADWDSTATKSFVNLNATPAGDGTYNMFGTEITFARFCSAALLGNGNMHFPTADVMQIAPGFRIKVTFKTQVPDHDWKATCVIGLARENTI